MEIIKGIAFVTVLFVAFGLCGYVEVFCQKGEKTMTIKELKDLLNQFNDDDEVAIMINNDGWVEDIVDVYRSPFTDKVIITN